MPRTSTDFKVWGDSDLLGDVNARSYATFNDGAEFDNNSDVNFYDGTSLNINDDGDLFVDGTATLNNLVVNNSTVWNGTVVYGGAATYNGSATFNGTLNATGATTFSGGTLALNENVTANAGINFSGATYLRVPVGGGQGAGACTVGSAGQIYVANTTAGAMVSGHAYICSSDANYDGVNDDAAWQALN